MAAWSVTLQDHKIAFNDSKDENNSNDWFQINDQRLVLIVFTTFLALCCAYFGLWGSRQMPFFQKNEKPDRSNSSSSSSHDSNNNDFSSNVWEQRRQKGILPNSSSSSNTKNCSNPSESKPFSSSYYYAHNNSKGGYVDGLKMEDYTMNGPRLLSKGGKPILREESISTTTNEDLNNNDRSSDKRMSSDVTTSTTTSAVRSLAINRYLWDDPGDSSGMASLRIESLPDPSNSQLHVPWKNVHAIIKTIDAKLLGEKSLLVLVQTDSVDYRLEIKKLFGSVASVKTVVKPKRLIIQIQKLKPPFSMFSFFSTCDNLKPWPHPQAII